MFSVTPQVTTLIISLQVSTPKWTPLVSWYGSRKPPRYTTNSHRVPPLRPDVRTTRTPLGDRRPLDLSTVGTHGT